MPPSPHRQIFEKLVNKNEIKPKIRAIFPESLDPSRDFGKNIRYSPDFSTRMHL
jgi:hypothetical protein